MKAPNNEEFEIDSDAALISALDHTKFFIKHGPSTKVIDLAIKRLRDLTGICNHRWYLIVHGALFRHQCHNCGHNIGNGEMKHMIKNGEVDHDQMELVEHSIKEEAKSN